MKLLPLVGPQSQERLQREVALLLHASRASGNVAKVLGLTVKDDKLCIIMKEYKQSLRRLIENQGGV